jgi:hypothetical protein
MNAERYATPLPQLTDEVATLAARVDGHLKKMGAVWKRAGYKQTEVGLFGGLEHTCWRKYQSASQSTRDPVTNIIEGRVRNCSQPKYQGWIL